MYTDGIEKAIEAKARADAIKFEEAKKEAKPFKNTYVTVIGYFTTDADQIWLGERLGGSELEREAIATRPSRTFHIERVIKASESTGQKFPRYAYPALDCHSDVKTEDVTRPLKKKFEGMPEVIVYAHDFKAERFFFIEDAKSFDKTVKGDAYFELSGFYHEAMLPWTNRVTPVIEIMGSKQLTSYEIVKLKL